MTKKSWEAVWPDSFAVDFDNGQLFCCKFVEDFLVSDVDRGVLSIRPLGSFILAVSEWKANFFFSSAKVIERKSLTNSGCSWITSPTDTREMPTALNSCCNAGQLVWVCRIIEGIFFLANLEGVAGGGRCAGF